MQTNVESIYMGFRLEINGVYWYFKDSVQVDFATPIYCI
jgi:hypothetical protein